MPEPSPRSDEDRNSFVARCVSDDEFKRAHPDKDKRLGYCYSIWRRHQGKD